MDRPLQNELQYFAKIKKDLLGNYLGKFALIHGTEFVGAFENLDNAYNEGVKRFGRGPFLVRRVSEKDEEYQNPAFQLGLTHASL